MEEQKAKKQGHKGKEEKYKSLLVWDILPKRTAKTHAIQLKEIVEHLKMYKITAEQHSIKHDIDDILLLLNKDMDIDLERSASHNQGIHFILILPSEYSFRRSGCHLHNRRFY